MKKPLLALLIVFLSSCSDHQEKITIGECKDIKPKIIYENVVNALAGLYSEEGSVGAYKKAHSALVTIKARSEECSNYHSSMPKMGMPGDEVARHIDIGGKYLDMSLHLSWLIVDIEHNSSLSSIIVGRVDDWKNKYRDFLERFKDV